MFVIVLFVDCNSEVIKETKDWKKDRNKRIKIMEYEVGSRMRETRMRESRMREKSEEIKNLQSGFFFNFIFKINYY